VPLYEYECPEHGVFEAMNVMARSAEPAACPTCDARSPRIVSAPRLASLPRAQVLARDRNERSRHEPRVSSRPDLDSEGHCHRHAKAAPRGLRGYHGARPWVIEHA
jgi:putative FmdB family regulatory protein